MSVEAPAVKAAFEERSSATTAQRVRDYVELTKPRIAVLELVTTAVGAAVAAQGAPNWSVLSHALIGTALVAASASAMNHVLERHTDARMSRTSRRPIPAGRLTAREATVFSLTTLFVGALYLAAQVNLTTALLGLLSWQLYVCVYTPLKLCTSWNTFVGAAPGALPILMGWTATGRAIDATALSLFMIVFMWQFPHFMAIAWLGRNDYQQGGMKMVSVGDSEGRKTGFIAWSTALLLLPFAVAPALLGSAGYVYLAIAAVATLLFT
ncbi:MAG TPA: heme o synthase, partial [Pirellulales bacterium]